jgi:hypothetical protein
MRFSDKDMRKQGRSHVTEQKGTARQGEFSHTASCAAMEQYQRHRAVRWAWYHDRRNVVEKRRFEFNRHTPPGVEEWGPQMTDRSEQLDEGDTCLLSEVDGQGAGEPSFPGRLVASAGMSSQILLQVRERWPVALILLGLLTSAAWAGLLVWLIVLLVLAVLK